MRAMAGLWEAMLLVLVDFRHRYPRPRHLRWRRSLLRVRRSALVLGNDLMSDF